jgi:hypothetical protein
MGTVPRVPSVRRACLSFRACRGISPGDAALSELALVLRGPAPILCSALAASRLPRDNDLVDRSRAPRPSPLAPHEIDPRHQNPSVARAVNSTRRAVPKGYPRPAGSLISTGCLAYSVRMTFLLKRLPSALRAQKWISQAQVRPLVSCRFPDEVVVARLLMTTRRRRSARHRITKQIYNVCQLSIVSPKLPGSAQGWPMSWSHLSKFRCQKSSISGRTSRKPCKVSSLRVESDFR